MKKRIGIIYPEPVAAVSEYEDFHRETALPVELAIEFTPSKDSHEVADLIDTGNFAALADAGQRLLEHRPDVIIWACTSGSFVYGAEGAKDQAKAIADATGVPATSTSLAFAAALAALGFRRAALLGPYPAELTSHFEKFLIDHGIELSSVTAMGSPGASWSAGFGVDDFRPALEQLDLEGVDCVLLPDTAAYGCRVAGPLAEIAGCPVLAANPVSLWQACRLAGVQGSEPRFGVLADVALP